MLTSIHVDFVQHMGKCQALCVFCMRKILHCLSGKRIFSFFKGFCVFCMWQNTWNPLKKKLLYYQKLWPILVFQVVPHLITIMPGLWYMVYLIGGVGVSWCPSIRLLALCERNQAVTGGFPSLKASDAGLSYFFVMMSYGSSQFVFIFAQSVSSQVGNVADSIWRCKMTGDPIMQIRLA